MACTDKRSSLIHCRKFYSTGPRRTMEGEKNLRQSFEGETCQNMKSKKNKNFFKIFKNFSKKKVKLKFFLSKKKGSFCARNSGCCHKCMPGWQRSRRTLTQWCQGQGFVSSYHRWHRDRKCQKNTFFTDLLKMGATNDLLKCPML